MAREDVKGFRLGAGSSPGGQISQKPVTGTDQQRYKYIQAMNAQYVVVLQK